MQIVKTSWREREEKGNEEREGEREYLNSQPYERAKSKRKREGEGGRGSVKYLVVW